jgi:hypothetical protein
MAYLYEIVNAKYKGCAPLEKETEIRKEMMSNIEESIAGLQCI